MVKDMKTDIWGLLSSSWKLPDGRWNHSEEHLPLAASSSPSWFYWLQLQKKQEDSRKTSTSASLTTLKPLWITTNCGKVSEMGKADHLTCLLRNLYAGQEAAVRTRRGTMDWFQIGKGVHQGCVLSPCLFNVHAEYIMRNAGLDEAQAGIKISGRNINNLRYADDTTLMAENEKELKNLLIKVKEESEKAGLKLNIQKAKIMASGPITSWRIDGETMETVRDFIFGSSKITADGDCSHEIKSIGLSSSASVLPMNIQD